METTTADDDNDNEPKHPLDVDEESQMIANPVEVPGNFMSLIGGTTKPSSFKGSIKASTKSSSSSKTPPPPPSTTTRSPSTPQKRTLSLPVVPVAKGIGKSYPSADNLQKIRMVRLNDETEETPNVQSNKSTMSKRTGAARRMSGDGISSSRGGGNNNVYYNNNKRPFARRLSGDGITGKDPSLGVLPTQQQSISSSSRLRVYKSNTTNK